MVNTVTKLLELLLPERHPRAWEPSQHIDDKWQKSVRKSMRTIVQMWTGDRPGGRGHQDGLDGSRRADRAGWRAGRTGEPGRLGGPGVGRTGWTDRARGWTGWA